LKIEDYGVRSSGRLVVWSFSRLENFELLNFFELLNSNLTPYDPMTL